MQIMIAVDDSASMGENGIERATLEGLSIVEEGLRRVNAGRISLVRFGQTVETVLPFGETFNGLVE